jgi:hypothetical protein
LTTPTKPASPSSASPENEETNPLSAVPTPRVSSPDITGARVVWPTCEIPKLPPARGYEVSAAAEIRPRYEDIAQDGRVQLTTMMPGLGAIWKVLGTAKQMAAFRDQGVLPILRRLIMVGEEGPFTVSAPIEYTGEWRLAREDANSGGDRLFLMMWLEARAPIGNTLGEAPPRDAERVLVGRAYAEHVLSRPFASSAAERKVTKVNVPGLPEIPEDAIAFEEADALVAGHVLEPGRERLFAKMHTDSNQHVNSLVYPRLFEETVIKRMHEQQTVDKPEMLLARALEIRYRKPFFCGDRAVISYRGKAVSTHDPYRAAAVGTFAPSSSGSGLGSGSPKAETGDHVSPSSKASCAIAMWLS